MHQENEGEIWLGGVFRAGRGCSAECGIFNYCFQIAILETSAACHVPDVLEMPCRPPLQESGLPGEENNSFNGIPLSSIVLRQNKQKGSDNYLSEL